MAPNLGCCLRILKIVDFSVDKNILWNPQNAPYHIIFIIFSGEAYPRTPLAQFVNQHHNRANYASGV